MGVNRLPKCRRFIDRFRRLVPDLDEEMMVTRFHGIDQHKKYPTVSVLDHGGRETRLLRSCQMDGYLTGLGPEDAVVMEASCGSFYWAERVEATGAACYVLDPMRFRIITDSWNKTDRGDSEFNRTIAFVQRHRGGLRNPGGSPALGGDR